MTSCLICDRPVRFFKFKCQNGCVCKKCYEVVSLNFTQIITDKNEAELLRIYTAAQAEEHQAAFDITRRINQFILFDDLRQLICLPNHPNYAHSALGPEYYSLSDVKNCKKIEVKTKKDDKVLGTIKVLIEFVDSQLKREIWLLKKPIACDSLPYQTMRSLAEKIVQELANTNERMKESDRIVK